MSTNRLSYNKFGGVLAAALLTIAGCSTDGGNESVVVAEANGGCDSCSLLGDREARIRSLENELSSRDSTIVALRSQLDSGSSATSTAVASAGAGGLFPPNAKAGECYARILLPETYSTSQERVLVKEASERFDVIPASYENTTERVLVKEESTRLEVVPAEYEMVTETVTVRPASTRIIEVPATYKTINEQVLDKPATTVWKKGSASSYGTAALSETVNATGELMCLVEVPATYKTVSRQIIDTPATTREVTEPAVTKTVERRVVSRPASTREVTIPAVYDEVTVTKLVTPASQRQIEIPAEYRTVTKRELVSAAKMEWQTVMCDINATPSNIRALQTALQEKGYNVGGVDGRLGPTTFKAVNAYAKSLGIPSGRNYVPVDLLKKLDLNI